MKTIISSISMYYGADSKILRATQLKNTKRNEPPFRGAGGRHIIKEF
jgi:hypothetical protein